MASTPHLLAFADSLAKPGFWMAPAQAAIGRAGTTVDTGSHLTNEQQRSAVLRATAEVVSTTAALRQPLLI